MEIKKTLQQHKQVCTLVSEKKIKQSLDILADMISGASSGDLRDEYENVVMTYQGTCSHIQLTASVILSVTRYI